MLLQAVQLIRILLLSTIWLHCCLISVAAQTWCGKNYKKGDPAISPEGAFPTYEELPLPQLAFQCTPRLHVYLESDGCDASSILVDTLVTFTPLRYSLPIPDSRDFLNGRDLCLHIKIGEERFNFSGVPSNAKNLEFPIRLCGLQPRIEPYTVACVLKLDEWKSYTTTTSLSYLPEPNSGSVTTIDRKTGAMMIKRFGQTYEPVFPIGFYTDCGGYLATNLSILDEIKGQGFNTIHPVPPLGDEATFETMLNYIDDIGLYLMYDMRHSYQNLEQVAREVKAVKDRRSLLLWYTADEPDGPGDPLDATRKAYDLVNHLDGYHPVSIALNCADHFFEGYTSGADIVMPDVYAIGNNVTFSSKYETPCTTDFGCCGCDNCEGRLEDTSKRLDDVGDRLAILGWEKTKFIWFVPQAFGGGEFWERPPTGREWLAQALLSINHGARGIIPWIDPTPVDIKLYASKLALTLPYVAPFFFDENTIFKHSKSGRVDVGSWQRASETLIVATNLDDTAFGDLHGEDQHIDWVLNEGVGRTYGGSLSFEPLGSAIFLQTQTRSGSSTPRGAADNAWLVEHNEL